MMKIDNISVEDSIKRVKELIKKESNISPALKAAIEVLLLLISLLVNRLGLNSKNSSKPPSSDPNRAKKDNSDKKKAGAQKGHIGQCLLQVNNPDEVKEVKVDRSTLPPEETYINAGYEVRQVFDIDIVQFVIEYKAEKLKDSKGNIYRAKFPDNVTSAVQYGNNVKALAVNLSQYQLLPYKRIEEFFAEQINMPLSRGSI